MFTRVSGDMISKNETSASNFWWGGGGAITSTLPPGSHYMCMIYHEVHMNLLDALPNPQEWSSSSFSLPSCVRFKKVGYENSESDHYRVKCLGLKPRFLRSVIQEASKATGRVLMLTIWLKTKEMIIKREFNCIRHRELNLELSLVQ